MISFRSLVRLLSDVLIVIASLMLLDAFAPVAQAGLGSYFSGLNTRSRVIQICVVTMGIALLIMMKKFVPQECDRNAFAPNVNYAPNRNVLPKPDREGGRSKFWDL